MSEGRTLLPYVGEHGRARWYLSCDWCPAVLDDDETEDQDAFVARAWSAGWRVSPGDNVLHCPGCAPRIMQEREERCLMREGRTIDLRGPDGNAFVVLGKTERIMKERGDSADLVERIMQDAMSSDYNHLLDVCEEAVGWTYIGRRTT